MAEIPLFTIPKTEYNSVQFQANLIKQFVFQGLI
jgi:hypothetical protein